jgi:two-component system, chemotaxis family, chemotaxis protein CheY
LAWNLLPLSQMRVLIADDQRSCGIALADMVRYCGHEVVAIVGSGLEAIQAYTLHKPDLVLMDHWMPRLNGVTASRHIIAKNPKARVVLLSAWSPLDGADESGAICFLPKPVELARLNATLLTLSQSVSFSGHNSELRMRPAELFDPTPEPPASSICSDSAGNHFPDRNLSGRNFPTRGSFSAGRCRSKQDRADADQSENSEKTSSSRPPASRLLTRESAICSSSFLILNF